MCKYVVRQANSKQCIPEVVRVENPLISIAKNSIFCEDEKDLFDHACYTAY